MLPRNRADALTNVEAELKHEQADAMRRTAQAFEAALMRYRNEPSEVARADAQRRLWYLVVQREALGLNHHLELYERYEVPQGWRF